MASDLSLWPQVAHYLSKGGFDAADKRSIRAVSLLAHKFIMDVADESMQITSRRSSTRVSGAAAAACSPSPLPPDAFFVPPTVCSGCTGILIRPPPPTLSPCSCGRERGKADTDHRCAHARVAAEGREHIQAVNHQGMLRCREALAEKRLIQRFY